MCLNQKLKIKLKLDLPKLSRLHHSVGNQIVTYFVHLYGISLTCKTVSQSISQNVTHLSANHAQRCLTCHATRPSPTPETCAVDRAPCAVSTLHPAQYLGRAR